MMNALYTIEDAGTSTERLMGVCRMAVVYEDLVAHGRAMDLAHRLTIRFAQELSFKFGSWSFKDLADPVAASNAIETVATAQILLFSGHGNELPSSVVNWLDQCVPARQKLDGALVFLLAEPFMLSASTQGSLARLEHIAEQLGMDFLPLVPPPVFQIIESLQRQSSLLVSSGGAVIERPSCDHWGLNE
jgi:hypothetical protein